MGLKNFGDASAQPTLLRHVLPYKISSA